MNGAPVSRYRTRTCNEWMCKGCHGRRRRIQPNKPQPQLQHGCWLHEPHIGATDDALKEEEASMRTLSACSDSAVRASGALAPSSEPTRIVGMIILRPPSHPVLCPYNPHSALQREIYVLLDRTSVFTCELQASTLVLVTTIPLSAHTRKQEHQVTSSTTLRHYQPTLLSLEYNTPHPRTPAHY